MAAILTATAATEGSAQVHSYVEHRAPDLHNGWANNSLTVYDHESGQYVTDVQRSTDRFKKVMALYTEKTTDRALKKFDILGCHTWEEVQDSAAKAVEAYNAKEKGFKGFLRKVGRKFGKASPAHQGWIQTLPAGDYSAVVCGALTLIFGAAARMGEVRKKILDALDCLPEALDIPEALLNIYRTDQTLERKAAELMIALLEAIEKMLEWLDHKAASKSRLCLRQGCHEATTNKEIEEVAKSFAVQGHYGHSIEQKIDAIQAKSAAFHKQVEVCLNSCVAETNFLAKVNDVRGGVMLREIQITEEYVKDSSGKLDSLSDGVQYNTDALNSLTSMLKGQFSDLIKDVEWYAMRLAQEVTSKLAISAVPPPIITVHQLQELLQVDTDFAARDGERSLREGNQLKPSDQQRAAWVLSSPKFQSWFKSGLSDMLAIDGMGEMMPVSPMSYFCALLSQELGQIANAVPLSFFCGLHRIGDHMSDPVAIMRSLIAQLVTSPFIRQSLSLNFMSFDAVLGIQQLRLDFLCELFRCIVGSLTLNVAIFIIIDGVSWFETEPRLRGLSSVIRSLRDLVVECNTTGANSGVTLKLLTTSPKASIHTKHLFPREKQVTVPNETLGNGQTFNGRQMAMQQQRLLGSASSVSSQDSGRLSWMSSSNEGTPSRPGTLAGQNHDYFRRSNSSLNSPGFGT